jgi:hypothetical protein
LFCLCEEERVKLNATKLLEQDLSLVSFEERNRRSDFNRLFCDQNLVRNGIVGSFSELASQVSFFHSSPFFLTQFIFIFQIIRFLYSVCNLVRNFVYLFVIFFKVFNVGDFHDLLIIFIFDMNWKLFKILDE